ncbi:hypothetical protein L1047_09640 [Synechococcus sp. Nb3U1]|uniref:hypothetical protein n=1 Tax=Synechococcus sp. Nb3U1 TaxID=1914529 RepID=UPI001F464306|nr:hypothetical protein [Synechococcus sp. Nb3U1]MCF2971455.1 hypothetical protein [Synechococcus sp. Nb3U1]
MAIDNTLLWVLIGTAGISLLTLVYVLVDEGTKRRRYEQQKQEQAEQAAAAVAQSSQPAEPPEAEAGIPTVSSSAEPVPKETPKESSAQEPAVSPVDSALSEEAKEEVETPETSG